MLTMGNREDLLDGARRCLFEKGYARTTVRDISTAAGGVSMAAIGYHFGSKEALLNEALAQANREWGDELERTLRDAAEPNATALQRFEKNWSAVIASITEHRGLWTATFDILAQVGNDESARAQLAARLGEARRGLSRLFEGIDESDEEGGRVLGSFYQALLTGLAAQVLIDPGQAPSGPELAEALRHLTG